MTKEKNSWPSGDCDVNKALEVAVQCMVAAGVTEPLRDARILLGCSLAMPNERFYGRETSTVNFTQLKRYKKMVERRCIREPVSRILGHRDFWDLTFQLNPYALDPRPDSETLIEAVLSHITDKDKPLNVLDLGTGTGCLLLSILHEFPNSKGIGNDINQHCIELSQRNAINNGLSHRATFQVGDWCRGINTKFDVILCNPPYIPTETIKDLEPEVTEYEPHLALDGGKDGLDCYKKLGPQLLKLLTTEGLIFLEIGYDQKRSVSKIMKNCAFSVLTTERDLADRDRCVVLSHKHG
jgi:release factor glutamine methyltransferase